MPNKEELHGSVVISRRQLHVFRGRSIDTIETLMDDTALRVVMASGYERVFPMHDVRMFSAGDASEGAYAVVMCFGPVQKITGSVDHNDEWWIVTDADGRQHSIQHSEDVQIEFLSGDEAADLGDVGADIDATAEYDIDGLEGGEEEEGIEEDGEQDEADDSDFEQGAEYSDNLPDYGDDDAPVKAKPSKAKSQPVAQGRRTSRNVDVAPSRGRGSQQQAAKKPGKPLPKAGGRDIWATGKGRASSKQVQKPAAKGKNKFSRF